MKDRELKGKELAEFIELLKIAEKRYASSGHPQIASRLRKAIESQKTKA